MTEFNAAKTPVPCNNHAGHTPFGRPRYPVLHHCDLYMLTYRQCLYICLSVLLPGCKV